MDPAELQRLQSQLMASLQVSDDEDACSTRHGGSQSRPETARTAGHEERVVNTEVVEAEEECSLEDVDLLALRHRGMTDLSGVDWFRCSSLTTLVLSNNSISSLMPLQALSSLSHLNVSNNLITSLEAVQPIGTLQELLVSRNQIVQLPGGFSTSLPGLTQLSIAFNKLGQSEQTLAELCAMRSLRKLDLEGNPLVTRPSTRYTIMEKLCRQLDEYDGEHVDVDMELSLVRAFRQANGEEVDAADDGDDRRDLDEAGTALPNDGAIAGRPEKVLALSSKGDTALPTSESEQQLRMQLHLLKVQNENLKRDLERNSDSFLKQRVVALELENKTLMENVRLLSDECKTLRNTIGAEAVTGEVDALVGVSLAARNTPGGDALVGDVERVLNARARRLGELASRPSENETQVTAAPRIAPPAGPSPVRAGRSHKPREEETPMEVLSLRFENKRLKQRLRRLQDYVATLDEPSTRSTALGSDVLASPSNPDEDLLRLAQENARVLESLRSEVLGMRPQTAAGHEGRAPLVESYERRPATAGAPAHTLHTESSAQPRTGQDKVELLHVDSELPFACVHRDCGRRFRSQEKLAAHVTRRHGGMMTSAHGEVLML